jgi:hypothetical protein
LNRLQEEALHLPDLEAPHLPETECLPRLDARQDEDSSFDPPTNDFATTQEAALLREGNEVQFVEGKIFIKVQKCHEKRLRNDHQDDRSSSK